MNSCDASAKSFKRPAQSFSGKGGKIVLQMENLWKINLNFVKDVPTIYVNFMVTVMKKKNRRFYFGTDFRSSTPSDGSHRLCVRG